VEAIKAAVVGAGAIGARLDRPGAPEPLTHAGGMVAAGFDVAALVDIDPSVEALARAWACDAHRDFDGMMRTVAPAVVSLAVPTPARAELLRRTLTYRPRLVIAEKPLTTSVQEAEQVVAAYAAAAIPLLVNYSRRFTPAWQRLIGTEAMSATIRYAKGIRHNGTHALDLCRMLFGTCITARPLSRHRDFWPDDPSVSAFLRFEGCAEVFLAALDERCFTLFEVDIICRDARFVVDRDGRRLRRFAVHDGVGIPSGKRLVEVAEEDTGASLAMLNLMRHARDVLDGASPLCSGKDALEAQRIAEQLIQ
jgi:predicted dehydrogenase